MGFQVPGTLGHKILNGAFDFDYYGRKIEVRAVADQIDGFSAHADQSALLQWLGGFKQPKQILLNHGDKQVLEKFAIIIAEQLNFETKVLKFNNPLTLK